MDRHRTLQRIYKSNKYFKVVCGAGNEDAEEVHKLALIYTLAGATAIDVSANAAVVRRAYQGVSEALKLAKKFSKSIPQRPFVNVSIGLKGDPHIRKAKISADKCRECGECIKHCPQKAIPASYRVTESRCIGCGSCFEHCKFDAISFYDKRKDFNKVLGECIAGGAETLELHAVSGDDSQTLKDWKLINKFVPNNYVSMCIDRSLLSNRHLIERIREAKEVSGERLVIQADGIPMSGGSDDYNTTLQAIAIADVIRKSGIKAVIVASGGTNSYTADLARLCKVGINGVAIGTFARNIVRDCIDDSRFLENSSKIKKAVRIAEGLIKSNLGKM